jgi:hypothetical protein
VKAPVLRHSSVKRKAECTPEEWAIHRAKRRAYYWRRRPGSVEDMLRADAAREFPELFGPRLRTRPTTTKALRLIGATNEPETKS